MTRPAPTFGKRSGAADRPSVGSGGADATSPVLKRSALIGLCVAGVAAAALLVGQGVTPSGPASEDVALAPAEQAQEPKAFAVADHAECVATGDLDARQCDTALAEAAEQHLTAAPRFADQAACEGEFGADKCRMVSFDGSRVFIPAMAGFLAANVAMRAMQSGQGEPLARAQPLYPPSESQKRRCTREQTAANAQQDCSPRYSSSGGVFIVAGLFGGRGAAPAGPMARTAFAPAGPQASPVGPGAPSRTSPAETRRGGFGQTATSHGSSSAAS